MQWGSNMSQQVCRPTLAGAELGGDQAVLFVLVNFVRSRFIGLIHGGFAVGSYSTSS